MARCRLDDSIFSDINLTSPEDVQKFKAQLSMSRDLKVQNAKDQKFQLAKMASLFDHFQEISLNMAASLQSQSI